MADFNIRAMKLFRLFETLTPAPATDDIDDIAKMVSLAISLPSPIDAEFDVDRPVHLTLKDIGSHVIDFMDEVKKMREMREHQIELPQDIPHAYFLKAYPMMLTLGLKVMVKKPHVAVTNIHGKGKGVVATTDISANTIVTFYPFDLIRIRCYENSTSGMCWFATAHIEKRNFNQLSAELDDYKFSLSNVDIYGDPKIHSEGCCGHIINDGDGHIKGTNNSILVPLFGGAIIAVIAVFDIKAGAEILAAYGVGYWAKRI